MKHLTNLFFLCLGLLLQAQTIEANLIELNWQEDGNPKLLTPVDDGMFFTGGDNYFQGLGRELWFTDGTQLGTYLVKDINPGDNGSLPTSLIAMENVLYFAATDGENGKELWRSDGTNEGTYMVKDIYPNNNNNSSSSGPNHFVIFGDELFFIANDGVHGYELWKSDGTEEGTVLVTDINPGISNGVNGSLYVWNNELYFSGNDGEKGNEIWKTDGSASGTILVKNVNRDADGLMNNNTFVGTATYLYFMGDNGTTGLELWKTDGSTDGTELVKNIWPGGGWTYSYLKASAIDDLLIFVASDGVNGAEIWRSNGESSGTVMIKDINNTPIGSVEDLVDMIAMDGDVYFVAEDDSTKELWRTDGTVNGTEKVSEINTSTSNIFSRLYADHESSSLYLFAATTENNRSVLWKYNLQDDNLTEVAPVYDAYEQFVGDDFVRFNDRLFFSAENDKYGNELWVTDGTESGTMIAADVSYFRSGSPDKFVEVNDQLFFRANRGNGRTLFKSDGSILGTDIVSQINDGDYDALDKLSNMVEINGVLYFSANDGIHGYELWRSDGTETGTYLLKDTRNGPQSGLYNSNDRLRLYEINGLIYFFANDGVHGSELWRSDGTENGTFMIKDINTGNEYGGGSFPFDFVELDGLIYFIARDTVSGTSLWSTDGSENSATKIISLNNITILKKVEDKLFLLAGTTSFSSKDLWVSDGTLSGTTVIDNYGDVTDFRYLHDEGGLMYFVAQNQANYKESLYKTDGTPQGTEVIFSGEDHPLFDNIEITNAFYCGGNLYYRVVEIYGSNEEWWRLNNDVPELVIENAFVSNFSIKDMECFYDNLLFLAKDHKISFINSQMSSPEDLDVTIIGGEQLTGFNAIHQFGILNDQVYFQATTNQSGSELYLTDLSLNTLSIESEFEENYRNLRTVKVYPNPVRDNVIVESKIQALKKIEIYDISGKTVLFHDKMLDTYQTSISCQNLSKGIYLMNVYFEGNTIEKLKLIIE